MANQTKAPKKSGRLNRKAMYALYRTSNKRLTNKLRKIARHQKKHPNDTQEVGTVPNYKPTKLKEMHYRVDGKIYVFRNRWVKYKKGGVYD